MIPPSWKSISGLLKSECTHKVPKWGKVNSVLCSSALQYFTSVSEIIDPVFAKTCPKCSFSITEYERCGLVFMKTRVYKFGHRGFHEFSSPKASGNSISAIEIVCYKKYVKLHYQCHWCQWENHQEMGDAESISLKIVKFTSSPYFFMAVIVPVLVLCK